LRADSFHTKSHIFTTGGVILGGVAIKFGFSMADPIVAVIIILFIVKMIVEVFQESSKVLCDASWIQPGKIEKIALGVKGVKSSHEIGLGD